jgi:hypothetical protein
MKGCTMKTTNPKSTKPEVPNLNELIEKQLTPEARQALDAMRRVRRQRGFFTAIQLPRLRYVGCDQNDE